MENILITVSGGRTSGFMAVYLKELYKDKNLLFLYANTGKEKQETLDFIKKLDEGFDLNIVWLEASVNPIKGKGTTYKVVDYDSCSREGEPFEDVIKKYGIPSKLYRHCTRELKEYPIHKYAKDHFKGKYLTAMGIRADEKHRLSKKENYIYPLAEINVDKQFINDWWAKQSFNLDLKEHQGNCDFCFLKSKKKRVTLIKEGLNIDWWNRMELDYSREKQPYMDVRNGITIADLVELSKEGSEQISMLDDISFDCHCKST